jgi:hypothetical protein
MNELVVQICFVVSGVVTGCTHAEVSTNNPYLTSQDLSTVYVHDAPRCIEPPRRVYYTPTIKVTPRHRHYPRVVHRHKHKTKVLRKRPYRSKVKVKVKKKRHRPKKNLKQKRKKNNKRNH